MQPGDASVSSAKEKQSESETQIETQIETQNKKGKRKRSAKEITAVETTAEEPRTGLEDASIPAGSEEFQSKLFHLICVLLQSIRNACSPKELEESSKYLLTELTVFVFQLCSAQSNRLLLLQSRITHNEEEKGEKGEKGETEADFLSFLTFFSYSQITEISPVFLSVLPDPLRISRAFFSRRAKPFCTRICRCLFSSFTTGKWASSCFASR